MSAAPAVQHTRHANPSAGPDPAEARPAMLLDQGLSFGRLLAMPLDPILVDAARWRPGAASLPRSAIRPLCGVVSAGAPGLVAEIEAGLAAVAADDAAPIRRIGERLWPRAAAVLLNAAAPPDGWKDAGLPDSSFVPLARGAGLCLATALDRDALGDPTVSAAFVDQSLADMLRQAARLGPIPWGMALALMLCTLPAAQAPRDAAFNQGAVTALRAASDAALLQLWHWIETAIAGTPPGLAGAAMSLRQRATVLAALSAVKSQRSQVTEMQDALRHAFAKYAAQATQKALIAPIESLTAPPDDGAMTALESEARGLRRLALELRGLGHPPQADTSLQKAAQVAAGCAALAPVDRARLVELLQDSEAAEKLLAEA
jgi:hypothetical protein